MSQMTFSIIWSESAKKQLDKLDRFVAKRIILSVDKLSDNPYRHVRKIVGSEEFRLRVGDYRVFLDINNNELRVLVLHIGHRSTAYKQH